MMLDVHEVATYTQGDIVYSHTKNVEVKNIVCSLFLLDNLSAQTYIVLVCHVADLRRVAYRGSYLRKDTRYFQMFPSLPKQTSRGLSVVQHSLCPALSAHTV